MKNRIQCVLIVSFFMLLFLCEWANVEAQYPVYGVKRGDVFVWKVEYYEKTVVFDIKKTRYYKETVLGNDSFNVYVDYELFYSSNNTLIQGKNVTSVMIFPITSIPTITQFLSPPYRGSPVKKYYGGKECNTYEGRGTSNSGEAIITIDTDRGLYLEQYFEADRLSITLISWENQDLKTEYGKKISAYPIEVFFIMGFCACTVIVSLQKRKCVRKKN